MAIRASRVAGERLVAGELLEDEAVVRLVGVEGADDVVAVAPGVGPRFVELVAVGLGVAGEVEPVPAPALAVVRARRAAGRSPSRRRPGDLSFDERVDLLRRRRQAGQVERDAADELLAGRGRRGVSPAASSLARMNASIGLAGRAASTAGTFGRSGFFHAQ